MAEESTAKAQETQEKQKRKYTRRQPAPVQQQPIAPNPHIVEMEAGLMPLMDQRLEANRKVALANVKANAATSELMAAQAEFQQIEAEIAYRLNVIGQLKNGGMPVPSTPYVAQGFDQRFSGGYPAQYQPPSPPYTPVTPYPTGAAAPGVSSFPARNEGLYPDAAPRGYVETDPEKLANAASASDFMTPELRAQFRGQ
jgi:hypothetical protein